MIEAPINSRIGQFLESQALQFSLALREDFDKPFKGHERKQHMSDVEARLREELTNDIELLHTLEAWEGLSDRHFRISYAIFWNSRV